MAPGSVRPRGLEEIVGQGAAARAHHLLVLAPLLVGSVFPAPVSGFVQERVDSGAHARWYTAEIAYTIDEDGLAAEGIGIAAMLTATQAAFDAWQQVVCGLCHDPAGVACAPVACESHPLGLTTRFDGFAPKATIGPGCEGGMEVHSTCEGLPDPLPACKLIPNGNQVVVVRDPAKWYGCKWAVAMTLVSANQVSGEIVDADIMLNAAHHAFCTGTCGQDAFDLRNTLTHEVGHMLGLEHSEVPGATMFGGAPSQELAKRDLEMDDQVGICTSYRQAWQDGGCPTDEPPGGCAVGVAQTSPLPLLVLVLLAGLVCRNATSSCRPT